MDIQIKLEKIENGWLVKSYDGLTDNTRFFANAENAIDCATSQMKKYVEAVLKG